MAVLIKNAGLPILEMASTLLLTNWFSQLQTSIWREICVETQRPGRLLAKWAFQMPASSFRPNITVEERLESPAFHDGDSTHAPEVYREISHQHCQNIVLHQSNVDYVTRA